MTTTVGGGGASRCDFQAKDRRLFLVIGGGENVGYDLRVEVGVDVDVSDANETVLVGDIGSTCVDSVARPGSEPTHVEPAS